MGAKVQVPDPSNEPVLSYAPGSVERAEVKARLAEMSDQEIEIPCIIGGEEVRTGDVAEQVMPHDHSHVLARWHQAGPAEAKQAIEAAAEARREWAHRPWHERAAVFLRAAELLSGPWRKTLNGATMLCQSKTVHQAEIDSACELIDFFRFNARYAQEIYEEQPNSSAGVWNRIDHRPLEGFVYAVTPFNFTSIAGNLPTSPALMGNTVLWKPASSTVYSGYFIYRLLEAAGLPPGVINFIPGHSSKISREVLAHPDFAGLHFTGSTKVLNLMWAQTGENLENYRTYPRIVGETGGKDFIVAHASADVDALRTALVRGAFEYQGQKCSAVSRAYVPESVWSELEADLVETTRNLRMGDPADFRNFVSAVIDAEAFEKITGYVARAKDAADATILCGGEADDSEGWFIEPTIVRADDPRYESMEEEIFGPVLTLHVYPDREWERALRLTDETSPYALTGSVFANDRDAIAEAEEVLRGAAGNFYINDKPTGAVVGQQPFGGARASGTNDKAGSPLNLLRWVSPRSIKENLTPPTDYRYPFMEEA